MNYTDLLNQAEDVTRELIAIVNTSFAPLSYDDLYKHPAPGKWSAAECFEHLNSYHAYYNKAFRLQIEKAKKNPHNRQKTHKSTWLGKWAVRSVHPDAIAKKMNAVKHHNHKGKTITADVLKRYVMNCEEFLELIEASREIDLQKTKVRIEIMKMLRLNLGDFYFFMLRHDQRHVLQASNACGLGITFCK
ncbi:MAG TPA: DinB family protein [Flavobacteriales bacterium]|nr:DinB family protein [Flavobacteriales bacterium]HRJ38206.1 DinB family protein [Flavobacteriales bacterium]